MSADTNLTSPIFVVGHPRSGTTLLQLILAASPEVGTAPETHFFTYVYEPVASTIPPALLGHRESGPLSDDPGDQIIRRLAAKPEIVLDYREERALMMEVAGRWNNPGIVLDVLMRILTAREGTAVSRWLEKTPRHVFILDEVNRWFPTSQIVNIVRDPRDVISSTGRFQRLHEGRTRYEYCRERAHVWLDAVRAASRLKDHVTPLRYEDLIAQPIPVIGELVSTLGLTQSAERLLDEFAQGYSKAVVPSEATRKGLVGLGEIVDRTGQWKIRMSNEEADLISEECASVMGDYGYD